MEEVLSLIALYRRRASRAGLAQILERATKESPKLSRAQRREVAIAFRNATGWELSFAAPEPR